MNVHRKSTGDHTGGLVGSAMSAHAQLMQDLLVERFAVPTPEWHPSQADREDAARREATALRLITDNTSRKAG